MEINALAIVPLTTLLCYIPLLVVFLRNQHRSSAHRAFFAHLATLVIQSFGSFMMHANLGLGSTGFWQSIVTLGMFGSSVTHLDFAYSFVGRRDRWVVYCAYVLYLVFLPLIFTGQIAHSARIEGGMLHYELGPAAPFAAIFGLGCTAMAIYQLFSYYREETNPLYRKRLLYPLLGVSISAAASVLNAVPAIGRYPIDVGANAISAILISYSLLRYQWTDITLIVRRGLALVIVTSFISIVYLVGISNFHLLLLSDAPWGAYLLLLVAAALLALLVRPWREHAQVWVDKLFFPSQYDSRQMLEELASTLNSVLDSHDLSNLILNAITAHMGVRQAALLLPAEETGQFKVETSRGWEDIADSISLRADHPLVQHLKQTGEPLDYSEVERLPQFQAIWSQERKDLARLEPELFFPLIVKDDLIGILVVGELRSGRAHSMEDRRTLSALVSQASVAVESAHLHSETRARANELETLLHIAEGASSTLKLNEVLELTARLTAQACRVDRCSIFLIDESSGAIEPLMSQFASGETEQELWRRFRTSTYLQTANQFPLLRQALDERRPLIIQDTKESGLPKEWIEPFDIQSLLIVPLVSKGRCIGGIALDHTSPDRHFTPGQVNLATLIANQVAVAIENARLFQAERTERRISETLRDASGIIGSTLDLDELLQLILVELEKVVAFDRAALFLLQGDILRITASRGYPDPEKALRITASPGEHQYYREMERTRQPVIVADLQDDGHGSHSPSHDDAHSWLATPLGVEDQMIGFLCVDKSEIDFYTPRDADIVLAMANHAALAIEKARLYRQAVEEQRKAEIILQETFNGIIVVDEELVIQALNAGAEIIIGYGADDLLGKRLVNLFGSELWGDGTPLQRAIMDGERVPPEEGRIAAKDGMRDVLQGVTPLRDDSGRVFGYLLSIADITHLKEMDRLKSALVANVSHELRAPLASIKAYTELLLDDLEGGDRALRQQFLTVIDQETDRLSALISDILDLSRLESEQHALHKKPLDFSLIVENVLGLFNIQASRRGITFHIDIPEDLPLLVADEEMILTITKNLISNALKFSHDNGSIDIRVHHDGTTLVFSVADQGIGIPPEEIPRLFTKFYRVRSAGESGIQGTGLGLVLVKEAAEAHGGTVEVESDIETGSCFTVRIPCEQAVELDPEIAEKQSETTHTSQETAHGNE